MNILIVFFWSEHPFDDLSDWFWYWCGGICAMWTIIGSETFFQANVCDSHALTFPIDHVCCVACVIHVAILLCWTGITFWNYYHNQFKLYTISIVAHQNTVIWRFGLATISPNESLFRFIHCAIAMVRCNGTNASVNGYTVQWVK